MQSRYDEILAKYPDFKEKSVEITNMIGIPEQMLQSALLWYDKHTKFITM